MSWLALNFALPTQRLFLHHRNSRPVHLYIQNGNRLASDDRQIQLQRFLDLSLLALGDIGSDSLGDTLHRFGSHLQASQQLQLLAAVIERGLLPHSACMRRTPGENSVFSMSSSTSTGNWPT